MYRMRWALMALVVCSLLAVVGIPASAQDATPISVPTPVSAGCDQIPAYAEARQKIMDEMLDGIAVIFPTVPTPIIDHGDELAIAMFAMTPEQTTSLGDLYDAIADKIEKLDVPGIAVFYNGQLVDLYRMSAETFHEAARTDLMTAGQKYSMQIGTIGIAVSDYGQAATTVCPAFAAVTKIDQTTIGA